jgi:UPF0755 protein
LKKVKPKKASSRKSSSRQWHWKWPALFSLVIVLAIIALNSYWVLYKNRITEEYDNEYFYIKTGSTLNDVAESLYRVDLIASTSIFKWVAESKNYKTGKIKPGRYRLEPGMNLNDIINKLRSGEQTPLQIRIQDIKTLHHLAGYLGNKLEPDSVDFIDTFYNTDLLDSLGFNRNNFVTLFFSDTYQFYWNTSVHQFIKRMAEQYKLFWNEARNRKANQLRLSRLEIYTLASIVQSEQSIRRIEQPIIAGLYLNRLRKRMKLESDPTALFASGRFNAKRALKADIKTPSPYNTYHSYGLPPGPITLVEKGAIDAVLNAQNHNYIFMCAKADFSGYHHFSSNYAQHRQHALAYRAALDKRKIFK